MSNGESKSHSSRVGPNVPVYRELGEGTRYTVTFGPDIDHVVLGLVDRGIFLAEAPVSERDVEKLYQLLGEWLAWRRQ